MNARQKWAQQRVRELLSAKKMTQTDLAQEMGVSRQRVTTMLHERSPNWTLDTFERVFDALDHDIEIKLVKR